MIERDRIAHGPVGGIFVGAAHGKFVAIGFAQHHRSRLFETLDGGGVVGRAVALEDAGAAGGGHAASAQDVFDGERDTGEFRERVARGEGGVDAVRLGVGALGTEGEKGVQLRIALFDARVKLGSELAGGNALGREGRANRGDGPGAVACGVFSGGRVGVMEYSGHR